MCVQNGLKGGVGELKVQREHTGQVIRSGYAHDRTATGAGFDAESTLELEEAEGFPDRGARNAELLHHPVLGVQLHTGLKAASPNLVDELSRHA